MVLFLNLAALLSLGSTIASATFSLSSNKNLVVYWGQNSYGATHSSDTANWQKPLASYCQDSTYDVIIIAFLDVFFGIGGAPEINLANSCSDSANGTFSGTDLANCQAMASDIKTCQAAGKIVTLALGGASGAYGFSSDSQAQTFATTIWNDFLGGSSNTRPFGTAVLDGIDLDIEGGPSTGYNAFVAQLQTYTKSASKKYYYSAAPQCPYPDAYTQTVLNAESFDFVNIQFYNNYCGVYQYSNPNDWDYSSWQTWATTVSTNPSVKLMVGALASTTAGNNAEYYVSAQTLGGIAQDLQSSSSSFGGIMLWDASQAAANGNYGAAVKSYLNGASHSPIRPYSATNLTHVYNMNDQGAASRKEKRRMVFKRRSMEAWR